MSYAGSQAAGLRLHQCLRTGIAGPIARRTGPATRSRPCRVGGSHPMDGRLAFFNPQRSSNMNSIIWIVGAVVIVVAALSFFGLR